MDITPAAYAHWRESELGSITEHLEREAIFSQVPDVSGWNVLDAGCGDGTYAIEASRRGAVVTGLDCAWPMLVAARQREQQSLSKAGILWCQGEVEALPFQDASFDLVLAITVLCMVSSPTRVISELARVLRPGGMLLLGELGRFSTWAFIRRVRAWLGSGFWKRAHFWTTKELRALLRDAGLGLKTVRGTVYYPPLATCARLARDCDRSLSILGGWGAAFLAVKAIKPLPPALPPAGRLAPSASSGSHTSIPLGGYDVSRLFQRVHGFANPGRFPHYCVFVRECSALPLRQSLF